MAKILGKFIETSAALSGSPTTTTQLSTDDSTKIATTEFTHDLVDGTITNVGHLVTLSGVAADSDDLGTFTGVTIPDASDIKEALQALETAVETANSISAREILTVTAQNVIDGYVDLAQDVLVESLEVTPVGGPLQLYGVDYTTSVPVDVTRVTFDGDLVGTLVGSEAASLLTQGLTFTSKLAGVIGNSYSVTVVDTAAGGLSYTEVAGELIIDLGGDTPSTSDVVTYITTTSPSALIDVVETTPGSVVVASILSLEGGIAGDKLVVMYEYMA